MNNEVISTRCFNQDQSWNFERTTKFISNTKKFTLKVSICRNAYDNQSFGRVYMWDGNQWNVVVDVPISECQCCDVSYVQKGVVASYFMADHNRLLAEALKIVD